MYLLDTTSKAGQCKKLQPVWKGPYLVTETLTEVLYRIEGQRKTSVVHHDRLKICEDRAIPLWMRRKRHRFLENRARVQPVPSMTDPAPTSIGSQTAHAATGTIDDGPDLTADQVKGVQPANASADQPATLPFSQSDCLPDPASSLCDPDLDVTLPYSF